MTSSEKRGLVPKLRFPEFREAGEWDEKELAEVLNPTMREVAKPSSNYLALGIRSHGKGTFHKHDQAPEKNSMDRLYLVHRDDLVVNITFAWEGAIAIAADDDHGSYVSHRFPTYVFKASVSMPVFFRYVIIRKAFVYKLGLISPGGAGRNRVMNKNDFLKLSVLLPTVQEQQRIADCLASLDELITLEAQQLDTLKTHKKGLMKQLFPAEGETLPKLRFPEFRDAGEWELKLLGAVCEMQAGKFVAASEISERQAEGLYPCFGGNGLRGYTKTFNQSGRYSLIGRQGALCGNVNLVEGHFYATEHAVVTTPTPGIGTGWLFYNLCFLNLNRFATGQAQPGLSIDVLGKVNCAVPKNEKEQQKIADCLASLDDLITAQTQQLAALKTHKKGLMQQLFPVVGEVDE